MGRARRWGRCGGEDSHRGEVPGWSPGPYTKKRSKEWRGISGGGILRGGGGRGGGGCGGGRRVSQGGFRGWRGSPAPGGRGERWAPFHRPGRRSGGAAPARRAARPAGT